jgi:hypothetical protein
MIKSDESEYELFKKATSGKSKNNKEIKNEWIPLRRYYYTLPAAMYAAIDEALKLDSSKHEVTADKARIAFGKILKERTDKMVAEVRDAVQPV